MADLSLIAQMQEVERELALRKAVYGREKNQKKQSENELHMARMEAVLKTLRWLQTHEGKIRRMLAQRTWGLDHEDRHGHPVLGHPMVNPNVVDCCSLCGVEIPADHSPMVLIGGGRGGVMWAYCAKCEDVVKSGSMKSKIVEQEGAK